MNQCIKLAMAAALLVGTGGAGTAAEATKTGSKALPADQRNFVTCPIVRDSKTVPCWLAEYNGELYFLGIQTDASGWSPPYLGHRVLVEGKVAEGPRICGGIPLTAAISIPGQSTTPSGTSDGRQLPNPPITSVMRELDPTCNTMLPLDASYDIVGRRVPGPNVARVASQRPPGPPPAPTPTPPFKAETFTLLYEFDSELATTTINNALRALKYAEAVNAKRIEIMGYRATVKLSDGTTLTEIPKIAQLRAEEAANTLRKIGVPASATLGVKWNDAPLAADGINAPQQRHTDIIVTP